MATRLAGIPRIGRQDGDDGTNILTAGGQSIEDYGGWKVTAQLHWIRKLGLATVFTFMTAIFTGTVLVEQLASPAVRQGEINGATAKAVEGLATTQKESDERQAVLRKEAEERQSKALIDGLARIEVAIGAQGNELSRRLSSLEDKQVSMWNNMVEMKNRIGFLEVEKERQKNKEKQEK